MVHPLQTAISAADVSRDYKPCIPQLEREKQKCANEADDAAGSAGCLPAREVTDWLSRIRRASMREGPLTSPADGQEGALERFAGESARRS